MKKNILNILLFCLTSNLVVGQKTMATYYDYKKTKKKEVYQTDNNGTKNGSYKNYDEEGALRNEGTFKFDKQNGVFIEYAKFPNYAGKMQIKSKETYVDGIKEGWAVYFMYNENIGLFEFQKGNYKQGNEDGTWTKITNFDKVFSSADYDYIASIPAFKGSMFIKETVSYSNGEMVTPAGKNESFYYPSNKLYASRTFNGGTFPVEEEYYFPDGKLWVKNVYDNTSFPLSKESYYYNGKLKCKETSTPFFYEYYNEDGTLNTAKTDYMKQVNEFRQKK